MQGGVERIGWHRGESNVRRRDVRATLKAADKSTEKALHEARDKRRECPPAICIEVMQSAPPEPKRRQYNTNSAIMRSPVQSDTINLNPEQ